MEILTDLISYLPPRLGVVIVLMVALLVMDRVALGVLLRFRKENLPWGASSNRLLAAMILLVCLPAIVTALLLLYYVGAVFWQELADAFQQAAH